MTRAEAKPLTHRQRRAARLDAYGHVRETIAARCGVSVGTVRNWRRLPEYQAERERIATEMPDESPRETLLDLLHSDDDKIRLGAAQTLLRVPGALAPPGTDGDERTIYIDVNPLATPPPDDVQQQGARLQAMPEYEAEQAREAALRAQRPAGMPERAQDDPVTIPTPQQEYMRRHGQLPPMTHEQRAAEQERLLARRMRDTDD
jgi:hypothetical protein